MNFRQFFPFLGDKFIVIFKIIIKKKIIVFFIYPVRNPLFSLGYFFKNQPRNNSKKIEPVIESEKISDDSNINESFTKQ